MSAKLVATMAVKKTSIQAGERQVQELPGLLRTFAAALEHFFEHVGKGQRVQHVVEPMLQVGTWSGGSDCSHTWRAAKAMPAPPASSSTRA